VAANVAAMAMPARRAGTWFWRIMVPLLHSVSGQPAIVEEIAGLVGEYASNWPPDCIVCVSKVNLMVNIPMDSKDLVFSTTEVA
jgi:hypothetical protein